MQLRATRSNETQVNNEAEKLIAAKLAKPLMVLRVRNPHRDTILAGKAPVTGPATGTMRLWSTTTATACPGPMYRILAKPRSETPQAVEAGQTGALAVPEAPNQGRQ